MMMIYLIYRVFPSPAQHQNENRTRSQLYKTKNFMEQNAVIDFSCWYSKWGGSS